MLSHITSMRNESFDECMKRTVGSLSGERWLKEVNVY